MHQKCELISQDIADNTHLMQNKLMLTKISTHP
jgi:hypothetical protein